MDQGLPAGQPGCTVLLRHLHPPEHGLQNKPGGRKGRLTVDREAGLLVAPRHRRSEALHPHLDGRHLLHRIRNHEDHHHRGHAVRSQGQLLQGQGTEPAIQELLFVKRINNYGILEEDVYETAHLEILPPRQRSAVQDLSSQDSDGLWRITCLNSLRSILLYNDDRHWNKKLKADFLQSVPLPLSRNSTSGTRATTATTARRRPSATPSGASRPSAQSSRRPFPANEVIRGNFNRPGY